MNVDALGAPDAIDVWRVSVLESPIAELAELLSQEERNRAARFVFDRDRDQFVAVRGWLRRLLGAYLHCAPNDIRFALGPQGKPHLDDEGSNLHFNVSHSGDVGLLAFSRGGELGVDVERDEGSVDVVELARSCFSETEQRSFDSLPIHRRRERFFQLWSAKEAYIKARGGGLSIPLQDFSIDVRSESDEWSVTTSAQTEVPFQMVRRLPAPIGYAAAIAASGDRWQVQIFEAGLNA